MSNSETQRYALIGTGAVGGLYGGMLARSGVEVHFLLNSDYQHVSQHGLKVESPLGDFHLPRVHTHATAEITPHILEEVYGREVRMVRHDHGGSAGQ